MTVAPIVILIIGGFIGMIISMTIDVMTTQASNQLDYKIQDTLNRIEHDANSALRIHAANPMPLAAPLGYDNNTQNFANVSADRGHMLIMEIPLTTASPASPSRELIYQPNQPHPCHLPEVKANSILTGTVIYFIKDNKLWRRTLVPADLPSSACSTPWQQSSCQPGISKGSNCQSDDALLIDGVSKDDFVTTYYQDASSTSPSATATSTSSDAATRQTAIDATGNIGVSLKAKQTAGGRDVEVSGSLRFNRGQKLTL